MQIWVHKDKTKQLISLSSKSNSWFCATLQNFFHFPNYKVLLPLFQNLAFLLISDITYSKYKYIGLNILVNYSKVYYYLCTLIEVWGFLIQYFLYCCNKFFFKSGLVFFYQWKRVPNFYIPFEFYYQYYLLLILTSCPMTLHLNLNLET